MGKQLIKICGIRDPEIATQASLAGANLIGIIFHHLSPRFVTPTQATQIARATIKSGAIPVAVFVNQTANEMLNICETTKIKTVQLHGEIARAHHHLLPDEFQRIYVQTVPNLKSDAGLQYLLPHRDFILIDHSDSGQGKKINWTTFRYEWPFRWLLAGGLTAINVPDAINLLQPDGVDVSSGVESTVGHKDIALIQQFISSVRGFTHGI